MRTIPMAALLLALASAPAAAQDATSGADGDPADAPAEAPSFPPRVPTGRAVVFVDAAEGVDPFAKIYLYEVVAGRLRDHGFAVIEGDRAAESAPPIECLGQTDCAATMPTRLRAPMVVALRIETAGDDRLRATWRTSDRVEAEAATFEGEEGEVASALQAAFLALDPDTVPCVVELATGVRGVAFELDGARRELPALVSPGEHAARTTAPDRAAWSGPLTCEGGRVLRVNVE